MPTIFWFQNATKEFLTLTNPASIVGRIPYSFYFYFFSIGEEICHYFRRPSIIIKIKIVDNIADILKNIVDKWL